MTRAQRFAALQRLGCIACRMDGRGYVVPDIHHIVDNGYRRLSGGDRATIPLCSHHHRAVPLDGMSKTETAELLGPSLATRKREFIARYGLERGLLAKVDTLIGAIK